MALLFAMSCLTVLAATLQFIKSMRDIFVSISNREPITIREKSICLYDFEDNYYEIDFDGKQII